MKNNIILIGMPGCGKSTVGVVLAKRLGYNFLDSDLLIQAQTGKLLHEIIEEEGIEGFLDIENKVNSEINANRTVIATGGSAVYGSEAMEHLSKTGTVIFLSLSLSALSRRLGDLNKRGVTIKKGQTLKDLYLERLPLYEKYADLTIDCSRKSVRLITEEIIKTFS
ncbi:MAG: AAA family ATPase [Clostridiales bacterium]|nr:AAA family ATPase [Clostridiales bacterium]